MKKILSLILLLVALTVNCCAESVDLHKLANNLCQIEIEGYESSARYYENERLFTFSMQNTVVLPAVWKYLDNATVQEHYLSYIEMAMQLEDMIWGNGYDDVTVVTTFQIADGSAVYLTVNGIDCSRMVYQ